MPDPLKKRKELIWAQVFVEHINKERGFDYVVELYDLEDQPIDAIAVSAKNIYPKLKFQLTYAVEVPFVYKGVSIEPDYSIKPTQDAIDRKAEKFMDSHIYMDDIILIIEGYMNEEQARQDFTDSFKAKCETYYFKGIYYVAPKMVSDETHEAFQESYIITLKDAFKK